MSCRYLNCNPGKVFCDDWDNYQCSSVTPRNQALNKEPFLSVLFWTSISNNAILGIIKLDTLVRVFQLVAPLLSWNSRKTNFSDTGNFSSLKIEKGENQWFKPSCILVKQRIVSLLPQPISRQHLLKFLCAPRHSLGRKEEEPVWCWSPGSSQSRSLVFIALQIASRMFHALTAVLAECWTAVHIAALALEEAVFLDEA